MSLLYIYIYIYCRFKIHILLLDKPLELLRFLWKSSTFLPVSCERRGGPSVIWKKIIIKETGHGAARRGALWSARRHRPVTAATWQGCCLRSWGDAGARWLYRGVRPKRDHQCSQVKHAWMLHAGQTLSGCFFGSAAPSVPFGGCRVPSLPRSPHAIIILILPGPSGRSLQHHREGGSHQRVTKAQLLL